MPASSPSFAIFGSCISRDTVELGFESSPTVTSYVARHSLISAGRPGNHTLDAASLLESRFQSRSFQRDLEGSGLELAIAAARESDLLLMDVTDERHGIYVHPDGGVITRSVDGIRVGIYEQLGPEWRHVPFGSLEHLTLYAEAAIRAAEALRASGVIHKTLLISAPWATRLNSGEPAPSSMGLTAAEANEIIPLYEEALENAGIRAISAQQDHVVGDSHHKWGPAPFHYIRNFYTDIAQKIAKSLT